jgi:beta-glucosidase
MALLAALLLALPARISAATGPCGDPAQRAWCNAALSPDQRAGLLLGALTQDEKLSLLAGVNSGHTGQTAAVPRLGLRSALMTDDGVAVKPGPSTVPPIPLAIAANFDPHAATTAGDLIGNEARDNGNDILLGPTINIMRTPLGGRTFEAYGEDPFLTASTAVSWIDAAQAQGVIAEVKHFCCNNQEGEYSLIGQKNYSSSDMDERTMREIYLPAFQAAVQQAHAGAVMCAYNRVNDDWACENRHLLTDILKGEWGFPGMVGSDWQAYGNTTAFELRNGLDLEMPTAMTYSPTLVQAAVASGAATQAQVDDHVRRLLRTLFTAGFFDRPPYADNPAQIDQTAHAHSAQQLEEGAITLLKNDSNILPVDPRRLRSIALIGPQANRYENGNGTVGETPFTSTTPLQAIRARAGSGVTVAYDDGSNAGQAAATAKAADVAIVFASDSEGEYMDKYCPSVDCTTGGRTGNQDSLISTVAGANPNTVVVLETGDPVVTPWRAGVRGLLEAWYPGEEGGAALARVLFGDADPGGRLPVTFPPSDSQYPTAGDPLAYPGGTDVLYNEGIDVGYRWYDAHDITPAFAFGFGLSYTTFRYSNLQLTLGGSSATMATASVDVTNTGRRLGSDVPQLYIGDPASTGEPPRQLKGYRKVTLGPGQTTQVTFPIDQRAVSYWDVKRAAWTAASGCYDIMIGRSSRDIVQQSVLPVGGATCPGLPPGGARPGGRPSACVSRRSVLIHLFHLSARSVARVTVYINGRRAQIRRGPRSSVRVSLAGSARGTFRVRLVVALRRGGRLVDMRTYRTCAGRRPHRLTRSPPRRGRHSASRA